MTVQSRLGQIGVSVKVMNGAELGRYMNAEAVRWRRVIEQSKIKIEN